MREQEIKRLVKIVENSNIGSLEISRWGRTIKITKDVSTVNSMSNSHQTQTVAAPVSPAPTATISEDSSSKPDAISPASTASNAMEIKSPMVGTFYRAPSPDAEPYVDVGSVVKKGQVLCIIEAMKLMNEIESEADGKIAEILVENAQPVEYNQSLFRIESS